MERSGKIVHPLFSSVTYLCGEQQGGPTLVLDQRVEDKSSGNVSALVFPRDDSFMIFPGNRLHGVLPTTTTTTTNHRSRKRQRTSEKKSSTTTSTTKQRTTLMVGFWAQDVTKSQRTRKEKFGPCCTFPRCTRNVTWPSAFQLSHEMRLSCQKDRKYDSDMIPIRTVSGKVWERILSVNEKKKNKDFALLEIPDDLDQRFFVRDLGDFKRHLLTKVT